MTGWKPYNDTRFGWSISYPPGWKVDARHVSASLGPDHDIHGVAFLIPANVQPGTNLSHNDTYIAVENLAGKNCEPSQFVDPADNVHKVRADGRTYTAAESGDAGAGNFYTTRLFVVDGKSPCIAVRYFIHTTNVGAYDPGTIKEYSDAKLMTLFDSIRGTLAFRK